MKPIPGLSTYSAMKAAIIQLTRSMAVELASKGIKGLRRSLRFLEREWG
jgi:NAD(P)-dependent dehydrogenase (short-subunit alcohol dehydrogenase family)